MESLIQRFVHLRTFEGFQIDNVNQRNSPVLVNFDRLILSSVLRKILIFPRIVDRNDRTTIRHTLANIPFAIAATEITRKIENNSRTIL